MTTRGRRLVLGEAVRRNRGKPATVGLALALLAATMTVIAPTPVTAASGDNPEVFTSSGIYTVPTGATAIKIVAIGGGGGSGVTVASAPGGQGGNGSVTTAITNVTPGWELDVTIGQGGGAGQIGTAGGASATGGAGGAAGGSTRAATTTARGSGGGGGGSSTVMRSTDVQIVAGGGGGGGAGDSSSAGYGGNGGSVSSTGTYSAGQDGTIYTSVNRQGKGGSATGAAAAGASGNIGGVGTATDGGAGVNGAGGIGGNNSGTSITGGGGGGGYGGGGGATGNSSKGAGGGGGGSFVGTATSGSYAAVSATGPGRAGFAPAQNNESPQVGGAGTAGNVTITALAPPVITSATPGGGSATITWTEPTQPVTPVAYQLYQDGVAVPGKTASPATVTGLAVQDYDFTVVATTSDGLASTSTMSTVTPTVVVAPGAPASAAAQPLPASAKVTWTAPTSDGGSPIIGYNVYRASSTGSYNDWASIATPGNVLTYTDDTATNGVSYQYRVYAINSAGTSASYAETAIVSPSTSLFVSTWDTTQVTAESNNNLRVELPLNGCGVEEYTFTAYWGDGTSSEITSAADSDATHTYATPGTYTVSTSGTFNGFSFGDDEASDRKKLGDVSQWGALSLGNCGLNFFQAENFTSSATDVPDLTGVTTLQQAFDSATSFNSDVSDWDTSGVEDFSGTFKNAQLFDQNLSTMDTGSAQLMSDMFSGAFAFDSPLTQTPGGWDTTDVINMSGMFSGAALFDQDISGWSTGSVTSMASMFAGAAAFNQDVTGWNTSGVDTMTWMFYEATAFDQNVGLWDITNVIAMSEMFGEKTLPTPTYNAILTGWGGQPNIQSGVTFGAGSSKYSAGAPASARAVLTGAPKSWIITDGGESPVPNAPTNVEAVGGDNKITVSWTQAAAPTGSPVTSYTATASPGNATCTTGNGTTYTCVITTGVTNGNTYDVTVVATNITGAGLTSSPPVSASVDEVGPSNVTAPSLTGNETNGQTLSVTNGTWEGDPAPGYTYQWRTCTTSDCTGGTIADIGSANASTFTLTNAQVGLYVQAVVTGTNSAGVVSAPSNVTAATIAATVPGAPDSASAQPFPGRATVTWTAPTSDGGSPITAYRIERATSADDFEVWTPLVANTGSPATTYSDTGLTNNVGYKYRIFAINVVGTSTAYTDTFEATPSTANFVSTWRTTGVGEVVTLPLADGEFNGVTNEYDFTAYWGDGTSSSVTNMAEGMHTYAIAGTYEVTIVGTIKGFRFYNGGDRTKILGISNWGSLNFGNNGGYLYGATNLVVTATDAPDLTGTTSMSQAFRGATSFNSSIANWNTASVTDFSSIFQSATSYNQPMPTTTGGWNTGSALTMASMFQNATAFNQSVASWDTADVTSMTYMFLGATSYNQPIPSESGKWVTSNVANMAYMFNGASSFNQDIGSWNVTGLTQGSTTGAANMLNSSAMDITNYNALLVGWAQQLVKPNVRLGANGRQYSAGPPTVGRTTLGNYNWIISGDSQSTSPGAPTAVAGTSAYESVNVSWLEAPVPGANPVTEYTVTAYSDGAVVTPSKTCTTTGALSCTVTGLTNGVAYTFGATATNSQGTGPASVQSATVTPSLIAQTLTFASTPTVVVAGTGTSSATSSGDGAVTYGSADTGACTVDAMTGVVTGVAAGTNNCVITATAAATSTWLQGSGDQTFSVGQGPAQTVTFTNAPLSVVVGGTVDGVATSNGDGTVSYGSADDGACTVTSSGVVTGVATGTNTCVITATAAATVNWAQGSGDQTFSVGQGPAQTVTFTNAPLSVVVGGTVDGVATSNGDGAVSYGSADDGACTVTSSGVVTGVATGTNTCVITATAAATANWAQGSSQQTFDVGQGPAQTVTFTNAPLSVVVGGTVDGVATSNGDGAVTYGSADDAACTVTSSGVVTGVAAGTNTCVITATAAATANWAQGSGQQTFSVGQGPAQTVTFTNAPLSVVVGGTVDGVATSNGDGTVTYGSADDAACTVTSSGLVTGVATGTNTCVITATAAATANWAQGSGQQTFSVGQGPAQTVTFTNAPLSVVVGGTVDGVATSNGDGTVSYGSADDGACTVTSSGVVTGVAAGTNTCVITATAAATANWAQGSSQQTFDVGQGPAQTVTFTNAPLSVVVGGTVDGVATSNGDGVVSYGSADDAACTVTSSGLVTGVATGTDTCVITATAAATANWAQGSSQQTFDVGQGPAQTVTFTNAPLSVVVGGTVDGVATSNGDGTVSYGSADDGACTVTSSGLVTGVAAGTNTCVITATAAATANWAQGSGQQTFSVGQGSVQTVTFGSAPTVAVAGTGATSATTNGDGSISFASSDTAACTVGISTGVVTGVAAGTNNCVITATAASTVNWAQGSAQQTFSIGKGSQTIDFPQPADVTFGVPSVALAATSSSNLTVAFASTTPTICAVSGTTATIVGAGSCSVVASQGGDADYDPAADVTRTFAAGQASQTITFELPSRYSAEVATLPLQATATSGLAVTFTTQTPETCTVSGATANLVAAGTCTITASQAGNTNFVAAPDVTASTLLEQLPPQLVEVCSADGSCVRADLAGLDLSGVNMAGINFAGANFTGANITGSTLQGSNLAGANMTGVIAGPVDLRDTNLTGANFTGADLHGARMQNALLAGTNFAGANLDDVDFTKVRNTKAGRGDQNRVTIRRVNFTEASLRRTKFSWLRLVNVTFTDSNLRKSNMKGVLIDRGAGVRANFGSANLSSATLRNANYKQANFTRANLRNARFINVKLAGANLTKAKLNGTKFIKTSLKHTVRGKQTVRGPSGRIGLDALAMSKSPLVPPATAAPGPTGSAAASGAPRATGQPLPVVEASPGPTSDNAPEPSADVQ